jgi:hypothetical protein
VRLLLAVRLVGPEQLLRILFDGDDFIHADETLDANVLTSAARFCDAEDGGDHVWVVAL